MNKDVDENIDNFTKLVQDIKLTSDKSVYEYFPIISLNVIPDSYSDLKSAIKYGRDNISLNNVVNGLESKEMDLRVNKGSKNSGEVNSLKGRQQTHFQNKTSSSQTNNSSRKRAKVGVGQSLNQRTECVITVVN